MLQKYLGVVIIGGVLIMGASLTLMAWAIKEGKGRTVIVLLCGAFWCGCCYASLAAVDLVKYGGVR
jgi:hypothetical protein